MGELDRQLVEELKRPCRSMFLKVSESANSEAVSKPPTTMNKNEKHV
jgi:hypothetical protein